MSFSSLRHQLADGKPVSQFQLAAQARREATQARAWGAAAPAQERAAAVPHALKAHLPKPAGPAATAGNEGAHRGGSPAFAGPAGSAALLLAFAVWLVTLQECGSRPSAAPPRCGRWPFRSEAVSSWGPVARSRTTPTVCSHIACAGATAPLGWTSPVPSAPPQTLLLAARLRGGSDDNGGSVAKRERKSTKEKRRQVVSSRALVMHAGLGSRI